MSAISYGPVAAACAFAVTLLVFWRLYKRLPSIVNNVQRAVLLVAIVLMGICVHAMLNWDVGIWAREAFGVAIGIGFGAAIDRFVLALFRKRAS